MSWSKYDLPNVAAAQSPAELYGGGVHIYPNATPNEGSYEDVLYVEVEAAESIRAGDDIHIGGDGRAYRGAFFVDRDGLPFNLDRVNEKLREMWGNANWKERWAAGGNLRYRTDMHNPSCPPNCLNPQHTREDVDVIDVQPESGALVRRK